MYNALLVTDKPKKAVLGELWKDLQNTSWKATATARVIHGKAFSKWSEHEDTRLNEEFARLQEELGFSYQQATKVQRNKIISSLALAHRRSPAAIAIRLKSLGHSLRKVAAAPPAKVDLKRFIGAAIAQHIASS